MLKFNNFPPTQAGDVQMTALGVSEYVLYADPYSEWDESQNTYVDAITRCISGTIREALDDESKRDEILSPLVAQVADAASDERTVQRFQEMLTFNWEPNNYGLPVEEGAQI